jgi:HAD superfamily hydrolase (TIGR01490 family)
MKLTLFDLDGTLLPIDSDHGFNEHMVALGWADATTFAQRNDAFYLDYQAGRLDMAAYIAFATACWRDRPEAQIEEASRGFLDTVIRPALRTEALELVRRHQAAGDLVAIVTATSEFITRPIARLFGIEALIATNLARNAQGRVTGAIAGTASFREGKVARVEAWLAEQGLSLSAVQRSTFYSDSTNDLPLLERVSHPVVTNPSRDLAGIAQARGWPILRLFNP